MATTVKHYQIVNFGGSLDAGKSAEWETGVITSDRSLHFTAIPDPVDPGGFLPGTIEFEVTRVWTRLKPDGLHYRIQVTNVGNHNWSYRVFATDVDS
ncbi:hypothetical protein B0I31_10799 [Saccharothrix carnea]|uniref:Uncharacterized protein n=1 Tax=Saccharothrix carnea TaxID=1280637 RepID=A0A2P8I6G8_SACCR|nr:hypothetical protein [Saccharothrix carnea]PSL54045.1 hypothetical protein B0I31_10799 [Saccharothrix carnea]